MDKIVFIFYKFHILNKWCYTQ